MLAATHHPDVFDVGNLGKAIDDAGMRTYKLRGDNQEGS